MSLPRAVVPGRCYLLTRRCSERRFLMRPDPETCNAFVYCLAVAAARFDVDVVAFGTMSNHAHVVAVDRAGRLPEFLQYFHRLFACHQNVLRGRWENFWAASEQTSAVELVGPDDVLAKIVYAVTNPVKDHLVDRLEHWPGPNALQAIVRDEPLTARRPKHFFRPDGPLPELVELPLTRAPGFQALTHAQYAATLAAAVDKTIEDIRAARIKSGRRVLGKSNVLAQRWADRPRSREPRRTMNPRVACRDQWRRIETLQRNKAWLEAYREARARWLAGLPDPGFPTGTWWLRIHAAAPVPQPIPL